MTTQEVRCDCPVWRWTGAGASGSWHFATICGEPAEELGATAAMRRLEGLARGFGSLRVTARIGGTSWQTSVFPQKDGSWILPVKRQVRKAEAIGEGDSIALTLQF